MEIRLVRPEDETRVLSIYKQAFGSRPWWRFRDEAELREMWRDAMQRPGFLCLVALEQGYVVAMTWVESITLVELSAERGDDLHRFAATQVRTPLAWIRGTACDPWYKEQGITWRLKQAAMALVRAQYPDGVTIFTRMRSENHPIIRINEGLGFRHTGVCAPDEQDPAVTYGYWFLSMEPCRSRITATPQLREEVRQQVPASTI